MKADTNLSKRCARLSKSSALGGDCIINGMAVVAVVVVVVVAAVVVIM